ncbi:MAG: hypothetical protein R6X06_03380 [Gammaproteobacteria bacterium]
MNRSRKMLHALYGTLATLLFIPATLHATLLSGSVSNLSATRNIAYTQPVSVTLRWSMLRSPARFMPGLTVTSQGGTFTDVSGGIVLGTVAKTLSKTIPLDAGSTFTFTETLRVPRDVLFKAYQQNIQTIYYRRDFTNCPGTSCSTLSPTLAASFSVGGSSAAAFGISDFVLRFSDGALAAIVSQEQKLLAEVRLNVTGSGTIKGVWEVATPGSSAGTPFYQSLQLVTRQVGSGQSLRLQSPPLPTRQAGNHLVRFRLLEPGLSEEPPVLQYVVRQTSTPTVAPLSSVTPAPNASLDQHTVFEWQAVAGAESYKLEVVGAMPMEDAVAVPPLTGILIKSRTHRTRLTRSLLQKLQPGETYWWRVEALDAQGEVIAASAWSSIKVAP